MILLQIPVLAATLIAGPVSSTHLSFEQRVEVQRTIERVRYGHQIGTTRSFDEAVPTALIEQKVRTYLQQSVALDQIWHTPITAEALRRELERIAKNTRMPERLEELYAALHHDPVLIQETLARPVLVDRLARGFFAKDARLHAEARAEVTALHDRLATGVLDARRPGPRRTVRDFVLEARPERRNAEVGRPPGPSRISSVPLDAEEFRTRRAHLPGQPLEPGALIEEPEGFVIEVVLSEDPRHLRVATWEVTKISWDEWWPAIAPALDAMSVETVADPAVAIAPPAESGAGLSLPPCGTDDTWVRDVLTSLPEERSLHTAVWTGNVMIVWGGFGVNVGATGGRYDPVTDSWTPTSTSNAPVPRYDHIAVWTGSRMIVWGGLDYNNSVYVNSGARYDPITDTWSSISSFNAPSPRSQHVAVWTGSRMIVWGGSGPAVYHSTGGRYDPSTDSWQTTSLGNVPSARTAHTAVWTGSRMIVWGGIGNSGRPSEGGIYDPVTNLWVLTATAGAPAPRTGHTAIWTGTRMIVWGGWGGGPGLFDDGYSYDVSANVWTRISEDSAPEARNFPTAVWAGNRMIVWGGTNFGGSYLNTGGYYDPFADAWLSTPAETAGAPAGRRFHTAIWTGSLMVVWGGETSSVSRANTGARLDPVSNTWTPTSDAGMVVRRDSHTAVWTGNEMVVWGGAGGPGVQNTGSRYDPLTDTWAPTSLTNAPAARAGHTAVWTGGAMLIWGGSTSGSEQGGRYDPIADTWSAMTLTGAPPSRTGHTAIWTGRSMVVWGGLAGSFLDSGGRYDPTTDTWAPTSITGAPTARALHTAVWTGEAMLIWGGRGTGPLNTGGRYDPLTDVWGPISIGGAPTARMLATAIWTGSSMFVWGGFDGTNRLGTGGRYDPAADTWSAVSSAAAPVARMGHTMVWTGRLAVVWGGSTASARLDSGGRYDPILDVWTPTSSTGRPAVREKHSAVWTGNRMLVWGGIDGSYRFYSGGGYIVSPSIAWITPPPAMASPGQTYDVSWQHCGGSACQHPHWEWTNPQTHCSDGDPSCSSPAQCGAAGVYSETLSAPPVATPRVRVTAVHAIGTGVDYWSPWAFTLIVPACMTSGEVPDAVWTSDGSTLTWSPAPGASAYDVMYGSLSDVSAIGASANEACLVNDDPGTEIADTTAPPPPGEGWYFLVRGSASCGPGTYGRASSGQERVTSACP